MKKLLVIIMAGIMAFSTAACSEKKGNDSTDKATVADGATATGDATASNADASGEKVDLSAYPADINEWTVENVMDYFTQVGCFTDESLKVIQNEEECDPANIGLSKCGSYMSNDDLGNETVFVFYFDPAASQAKVKEQFEYIKANKTFDEALDSQPVDHVIGNLAISYSLSVDEDFYNNMDKAYNDLVNTLGITPEF